MPLVGAHLVDAHLVQAGVVGAITSEPLHFTATTTGASETVTITRLTVNKPTPLLWGDGGFTILPANSTMVITHVYASAGTYNVTLQNAAAVIELILDNAKLGGLNTRELRASRPTYFYVTLITASTINSADMVAWRPAAWYLFSMPAGTYTIASADMVAWRPTAWWLSTMPAAGSSYTFAASCMRAWTLINEIQANNLGLASGVVDTIVMDIYAGRAGYTHSTPVLNVGGTNAAPGGVYADEDPPVTGKGHIFELVVDPEAEGFYKWVITYTP